MPPLNKASSNQKQFKIIHNKGVCQLQCGLAIYIIKKYRSLKAKEELWKLKYFTMQKIILIFKKNPLTKETKILGDIITL